YGETYSPVCRIGCVRLILALANEIDFLVYNMDATNAFIQSREITSRIGHEDPNTGEHVCKRKRSLYGLQNSSLKWCVKYNTLI
ncbi:unnamed protein product, partial [Discosporangium mesarthrocarpum]